MGLQSGSLREQQRFSAGAYGGAGKRRGATEDAQRKGCQLPAARGAVACFQEGSATGVVGRVERPRRFGDVQVPEGFYELDWFNPQSNFYLSMHISYPNAADRILGLRTNPGGDIMLHGDCITIGCIPITDDGIKEVYWLGVLVRSSGQRHLPIHIFPARLSAEGLRSLAADQHPDDATLSFRSNLQKVTCSSSRPIDRRT
jgi:hypothetical protein